MITIKPNLENMAMWAVVCVESPNETTQDPIPCLCYTHKGAPAVYFDRAQAERKMTYFMEKYVDFGSKYEVWPLDSMEFRFNRPDGQMKWTVGSNMVGYAPEEEPTEFALFDDALMFSMAEVQKDLEMQQTLLAEGNLGGRDPAIREDIENLTLTLASMKALASPFSVTAAGRSYWVDAIPPTGVRREQG